MTEPALEAEQRVVARLARAGVLPVLTVTDVATVEPTCRPLLAGGVSCAEITYRTACFAVAPGLSETVVAVAREIGLPFFPGVATPSEIDRARP